MDTSEIVTAIAIFLMISINLFLTHMRIVKWFPESFKWITAIIFLTLGLTGFILSNQMENIESRIFALLCTPFVLTIIDKVMKTISIRLQGRNFYFHSSFEPELNRYPEDYSNVDNLMTVLMIIINAALLTIAGMWK